MIARLFRLFGRLRGTIAYIGEKLGNATDQRAILLSVNHDPLKCIERGSLLQRIPKRHYPHKVGSGKRRNTQRLDSLSGTLLEVLRYDQAQRTTLADFAYEEFDFLSNRFRDDVMLDFGRYDQLITLPSIDVTDSRLAGRSGPHLARLDLKVWRVRSDVCEDSGLEGRPRRFTSRPLRKWEVPKQYEEDRRLNPRVQRIKDVRWQLVQYEGSGLVRNQMKIRKREGHHRV